MLLRNDCELRMLLLLRLTVLFALLFFCSKSVLLLFSFPFSSSFANLLWSHFWCWWNDDGLELMNSFERRKESTMTATITSLSFNIIHSNARPVSLLQFKLEASFAENWSQVCVWPCPYISSLLVPTQVQIRPPHHHSSSEMLVLPHSCIQALNVKRRRKGILERQSQFFNDIYKWMIIRSKCSGPMYDHISGMKHHSIQHNRMPWFCIHPSLYAFL